MEKEAEAAAERAETGTTAERTREAQAPSVARPHAGSRQWILRRSARSPPRVGAQHTRKERRTNSRAKRRVSREERVVKHLAADEDRARRAGVKDSRPRREGAQRGTEGYV